MMNKILAAVIICFCTLTGIAQQDKKQEIPLDIKIVKMPKFPIADFPKKTIPVSGIRIIQFVNDSVTLGYVQKGLNGHVAKLTVSKPLTEMLQDHIEKMYKNDYKKGGSEILWVLKDLRIGERTTTFNNLVYAKFRADAYLVAGENYSPVTSMDTIFLTESLNDLTAWHGTHIEDALKVLLKETLKKATLMKDQHDIILVSPADIMEEKKKREKTIPILNDPVYREGGYANFSEFLLNNPSVPGAEPVTDKKKNVKFIVKSSENIADTINLWGYSKNGELFKYHEEGLVPIEKKDGRFIISDYVEKINRKNSGMLFGVLAGGVAGAVIASSTSKKMHLVTSIPYITKSKKQPEATSIDMETGEFTF